jgi:glycosyltransferase involved in cell wall biosynthesis
LLLRISDFFLENKNGRPMKNILWLASWYPNRTKPLDGDFIERHALAAAVRNNIHVLYVVKDDFISSAARPFVEQRKYSGRSGATIRYYKGILPPGRLESVISGIRYFFIFKKLIREYIKEQGKPDCIHVHISFRAGLPALYCRYRYTIPYVVSEQWSVFSPDAGDVFDKKNFLLKWVIRQIYRHAAGHTAVSAQLAKALKKRFDIPIPEVIPNVVDTTKFFPGNHAHSVFRFIHISTLNFQKNFERILEAVSILREKTTIPFELTVYGPVKKEYVRIAETKQIEKLVMFHGEVDHDEIALQIRHSGALILYSHFETFGCVVAEALVSGVPPIVSDIAVMHELVTDMDNGVIVPTGRPDLLADRMKWMIMNRYRFDSERIAAQAGRKYSVNGIADLFDRYYDKVIALH